MKELKYFYKIENDKLIKGSGYKIPEGFTEYIIGNEPEELKNLLNSELFNKLKNDLINKLKKDRDELVKTIKVELETNEILDANEDSQDRFSRALNGLNDDEEIDWIDYNNETIKLNKEKLQEALRLAGKIQTEIYIDYNTSRNKINDMSLEDLLKTETVDMKLIEKEVENETFS